MDLPVQLDSPGRCGDRNVPAVRHGSVRTGRAAPIGSAWPVARGVVFGPTGPACRSRGRHLCCRSGPISEVIPYQARHVQADLYGLLKRRSAPGTPARPTSTPPPKQAPATAPRPSGTPINAASLPRSVGMPCHSVTTGTGTNVTPGRRQRRTRLCGRSLRGHHRPGTAGTSPACKEAVVTRPRSPLRGSAWNRPSPTPSSEGPAARPRRRRVLRGDRLGESPDWSPTRCPTADHPPASPPGRLAQP
jgi:hypothetical protein